MRLGRISRGRGLRALAAIGGDRSRRGPGGAGDGGRLGREQALRERRRGATSNTCTVPTSPCLTIGHALSLAVSGSKIEVAAGNYAEQLVINKSVSIIGSANKSNPTMIESLEPADVGQ